MEVLVVGQGIFGVTAAIELSKRGYKVSALHAGDIRQPDPFSASTDISKLVRLDYGKDEIYMEMMEQSLKGWKEWNSKWKEDVYHESGVLCLSSTPMQEGSFPYESYRLLQARGHNPVLLNARAFKDRYPAWNSDHYRYGYLNPNSGWAESTKAVAHLLEEAVHEYGVRSYSWQVKRLLYDEKNRRVIGIETTQGYEMLASFVVVAAGAWTPTLVPHLQGPLRASGHVVFHFQPPESLVPRFSPPEFPAYFADIETTGFYGFPSHPNEGGRVKIGNHGVGHKIEELTAEGIKKKLDEVREKEELKFRVFISNSFPALSDSPTIFSRMCLYCDSLDGDFLIDHDPDHPGLFVASGDSGHGFKFGPVLGTLIAEAFEGKSNKYTKKFAWREMVAQREDARCLEPETHKQQSKY